MSSRYRIGKAIAFDATRTREGRPDGSGFVAEATFTASELGGPGFVVDFGELVGLTQYIDAVLDHRNLDDVLGAGAAGNGQIAVHLESWCRANLPETAAARFDAVAVRDGRISGAGVDDLVFSAQHRLGGLPEGHKCGREHGHTYLVGPIPGEPALPGSVRRLVAALERSVLNTMLQAEPTSEHLARYLVLGARSQGDDLRGLRVSETASTWAQYSET